MLMKWEVGADKFVAKVADYLEAQARDYGASVQSPAKSYIKMKFRSAMKGGSLLKEMQNATVAMDADWRAHARIIADTAQERGCAMDGKRIETAMQSLQSCAPDGVFPKQPSLSQIVHAVKKRTFGA